MSELAIAVVVVCRDSEEAIDACLARLRAAEGVAEIRVVDCNSRDTTLAIVQRHALADARLRFIANPDDPGHGAACNQGVAACRAPWLVLLDPGCLVEPDALMHLRDLAARDNAMVGADLVDEAGVREPAARLGVSRVGACGNWRRLGLVPVGVTAEELQDVAALSGDVMVLPRARFDALGGFDPGYATALANLDLCRRARVAGMRIGCANGVQTIRMRGQVTRMQQMVMAWCRRLDASRYLWRNGPHSALPIAWACLWSSLPWAVMRAMLRR